MSARTVALILLISITWFIGSPAVHGEESLFERTLTNDAETAERQELLDWAGSLGLSTRGTRRQIEDRILGYYGVRRRPSDPQQEAREGATMRIERARGSRFFDVHQVDERNLRLVGGVRITVDDDGIVHTIEADEILINVERNTLGARGNVFYEVRRPDGEERFRGSEIVFRIDTWEGVFIRGITETAEQIDDESVDFFVEGRRISRSAEEIIVVEDGTITSSGANPPNWRIHASRIWILAPGEWGIRHAVLYVGRVPSFYLPFFFLPGDRLFFHPVAGNRTREGTFIQTTTYVFGQREDEEPPLSIMRIAETPDESERVIQGLFLRIPEEPVEQDRPDWTLKFMADVYTTLGAYGGVAASMPGLGPISTFDWRLGIGVSRNIYFQNGLYTSYYVDEGDVREHWNSGFFLGTSVPYRYEIETVGRTRIDTVSINWNLLLLSDPEFRRDFHDRSERMDWTAIISPSDTEESTTGTSVSSLNWEAGLAWNPSVRDLNPWVTSFSVSRLRAQATWRTRTDEERPDAVRSFGSDNSPEERFFFPQSVVVPELQMRAQGTLWRYPSVSGQTARRTPGDSADVPSDSTDEDEERRRPLRPPWEPEEETPVEREEHRFRLPDRISNVQGIRDPDSGAVTVTYNIQPTLRRDQFSDSGDWRTGSDVDFAWRYSTLQTRNRGQVNLDVRSRDRLATASSTLSLDHRYQSLDIMAEIEDRERDRLELDTFRFRGYTANQASQATVYPLRRVDPLENSSLRYSLSSLIYENRFVEIDGLGDPRYERRWGTWDVEDISTHRTRAQIQWNLWSATQSLTATSDLPPRDRTYLGELRLVTGPVTTTLTGGYRERDDEWVADNIVQNHNLQLFGNNLRLEQRLVYSAEEEHLLQSQTSLRVWPLTMRLVGRRTTGYEFDPTQGWVRDDDEQFHWTGYTVGLGGEREISRWHRRVDLSARGQASLDVDLQRYTNSALVLDYGFGLSVYRFADISVTARSRNDFVYQYFGPLAEEIGRTPRNVLEDLAKSVNVFDREAREETFFKIDSLTVTAVHDLQDWELSIRYTGRPELQTSVVPQRYEWRSLLTILLRWRPISELRRNIQVDEQGTIEFIE